MTRLAEIVVGPWADWSVVTLVDHSLSHFGGATRVDGASHLWRRGLRDVAGWHRDPETRDLLDRYVQARIPALSDDSFLAQAVRQNHPVVVPEGATESIAAVLNPGEARDLCLELAPSAMVILPLRARERTIGLLSVFRGTGRDAFDAEDIADLTDAAARAGVALDNVRLYAEQRDLAEGLQRSLLTAPPVPDDHVHVAVRYEPAAEAAQVGGDWYDSFLQKDGTTNIVIGDVVGHDTVAAAAMGQVRGLLRGISVTTGAGPADVLRHLDEAMETLQVGTIATAIVARLEQTPGEREAGSTRLRWSNAGHPPPIVAVHGEPGVEVAALWPDESDLMLGLMPSSDRNESVIILSRGSTVLLYTDGLVERRGQPIDEGVEKLRAVMVELVAADLDHEEMCDELLRRMLPDRPEDDVAIVAVRLHPWLRPGPTGTR